MNNNNSEIREKIRKGLDLTLKNLLPIKRKIMVYLYFQRMAKLLQ